MGKLGSECSKNVTLAYTLIVPLLPPRSILQRNIRMFDMWTFMVILNGPGRSENDVFFLIYHALKKPKPIHWSLNKNRLLFHFVYWRRNLKAHSLRRRALPTAIKKHCQAHFIYTKSNTYFKCQVLACCTTPFLIVPPLSTCALLLKINGSLWWLLKVANSALRHILYKKSVYGMIGRSNYITS
jgi:hypothetical protein